MPGIPGLSGEDGDIGQKVGTVCCDAMSLSLGQYINASLSTQCLLFTVLCIYFTWYQGDIGLQGPRGPDGAPGKGVPGEKVQISSLKAFSLFQRMYGGVFEINL